MVLLDKNLFPQKLINLLVGETSIIGEQLENHGRIKKYYKRQAKTTRKSPYFY